MDAYVWNGLQWGDDWHMPVRPYYNEPPMRCIRLRINVGPRHEPDQIYT